MGRLPIEAQALASDALPLAIATSGLTKRYGSSTSLEDCSIDVRSGEVYGLLGPNGAGKTTLIRTLLGFIKPTRGSGQVCGFDIVSQSLLVRQQVSYLPADARLYLAMRGRDILELFAGLHHHGDIDLGRKVAERLGLDLSRRVMFMSTGMRQKLAIVVALGCRAPLTILDEPTANLDPNVRTEVMRLIAEVRDRGGTVLLSSHIFSDIDDTCDRVGILRGGRLAAVQDLRKLQLCHVVKWSGTEAEAIALRAALPDGAEMRKVEGRVSLQFSTPPNQWLPWLSQQPGNVISVERAGVQTIYDRVERERLGAPQGKPSVEQDQHAVEPEERSVKRERS